MVEGQGRSAVLGTAEVAVFYISKKNDFRVTFWDGESGCGSAKVSAIFFDDVRRFVLILL